MFLLELLTDHEPPSFMESLQIASISVGRMGEVFILDPDKQRGPEAEQHADRDGKKAPDIRINRRDHCCKSAAKKTIVKKLRRGAGRRLVEPRGFEPLTY